MLQSTVNLLGNTSAVWNNQYLKKILRIPEEQLEILNNIPGWSSEKDNNKPSSSSPSKTNKNPVVSSKAQTKVIVKSKENPVLSKEIEKQLEDTNKKSFPLRKSSSLNSINIKKSNYPQRKLTRSSSTTNIKEKTNVLKNTSLDTTSFNLRSKAILTEKSSLSSIKEVTEMPVDMNSQVFEKSNFASSGVQCKMSQDFNSDLNAFATTALPPSNNSLKRQTLKLLNSFSPSNQTDEREKIEKLNLLGDENNQLENVSALLKENLNEKSKIDIDENCISLPVPCAQPTSENVHFDNEPVTNQKDSMTTQQNKSFCSTTKEMQNSLDKNNPHPSGKRKRKLRPEKSKKHRGENTDSIKVEYSSEQIMNMFELIKILHK